MKCELLYEIVECDNCGAKYVVSDTVKNKNPFLHSVCNNCYMPMKVKNPIYKEEK